MVDIEIRRETGLACSENFTVNIILEFAFERETGFRKIGEELFRRDRICAQT